MKFTALVALSFAIGLLPHFVNANEESQVGTASAPSLPNQELHFVSVLTLRGVVLSLDPVQLLITLRNSDGKVSTFEVRRKSDLEGVKAGDSVAVRYFEGSQVYKTKSRRTATISSVNNGLVTDNSRIAGKRQRRFATVVAVDLPDQELTVEGKDGNPETLMISNPEQINGLKAGDQVEIERAEALVLSIEKDAR